MNRLADCKYLVLLVALLLLLVTAPIFRGPGRSPLLSNLMMTVLFLASVWAVLADRQLRVVGLILALPAIIGVWTGYAAPDVPTRTAEIGFHLCSALYQVFMVVVLVRAVNRERTVSADAIYGALCGYLVIGLVFGHVYCIIDEAIPGSFSGVGGSTEAEHEHFLLTYFSFVTLTTVGFGDITPTSAPARSLSILEAVTGQFYLAVLIAGLVGKRLSQVRPVDTSQPG